MFKTQNYLAVSFSGIMNLQKFAENLTFWDTLFRSISEEDRRNSDQKCKKNNLLKKADFRFPQPSRTESINIFEKKHAFFTTFGRNPNDD